MLLAQEPPSGFQTLVRAKRSRFYVLFSRWPGSWIISLTSLRARVSFTLRCEELVGPFTRT